MVEEINEKNEEKLNFGKWIIDFWAPWCPPCKIMSPIFHELEKEIEGINFASVNVDLMENLAHKFGIMSIPTFLILDNGKEKARFIGATPKERFREWILQNV